MDVVLEIQPPLYLGKWEFNIKYYECLADDDLATWNIIKKKLKRKH